MYIYFINCIHIQWNKYNSDNVYKMNDIGACWLGPFVFGMRILENYSHICSHHKDYFMATNDEKKEH